MSYATEADIDAVYGTALLDLLAMGESIEDEEPARDTARIERALEEAAGIVNGYVSSRHPLPLSSVPPLLKTLTIDLAVHRLAARPGMMTTEIEERAKIAHKTLEAIGAGRAGLGLPTPSPEAQASDAPVLIAPARRFRRDGGL